jgi:SAM-dependent methyltransferase
MGAMDRRSWLADRRAATVATYDAEAPEYEANDYPHDAQLRYVARVLEGCLPGGLVLDAPCGTGRYFPLVATAGLRVVGADQSAGMLAQARARGIAERLLRTGLQELDEAPVFDAVLTIDALENVPPEDWPVVLANLRRAARPGGQLYLTVEEWEDEAGKDAAFEALLADGLPAVHGEVVEGDVAGYHFYPEHDRVLAWIADAGLEILEDVYVHADADWGYRHLLLRKPRDGHA